MNMLNNQYQENGLLLHANVVLGARGAMLFLGHSGSGKTTLSKLLFPHFDILKDDVAFIQIFNDDIWYVDTEHHNSQPLLSKNVVYYPLHAIFRIFGNNETLISPLSPIKACEYLVDAVFEIENQRQTRNSVLEQRWFFLSAQIAKQCPSWLLWFSLHCSDVLAEFEKINIFSTLHKNHSIIGDV